MLNGLINVAEFLISIIFGLYAFILLFRFFLQKVKADFYNPICQLVMKATNIFVMPLRKLVPGIFGFDWACIVAVYFVFMIQNLLLSLLSGISLDTLVIFIKPFLDMVFALINMFIYLIIIRAISSWFAQGGYNPMLMIIYQITEPLLAKARRLIAPRGGFDFSPIIVLLSLFCIQIFLQSVITQLFS